MKVYSEIKTGTDGKSYSVRYLLTEEERTGLTEAGILGYTEEVIGIFDVPFDIQDFSNNHLTQ